MFMGETRAVLQATDAAKNADVIVASILGDKSLYLSKKISIVAEQIKLFGKPKEGALEVFYTVNGEDPATKGISYFAPFEVEDGTTVKALVKLDDEVLFTMEEKFGQNEGLFWGNEKSEKKWKGRFLLVQAEDGELSGAAKIIDGIEKGVSGYAYVTFDNKEGAVTWYRENDGEPVERIYQFSYAHDDPDSKRPMTLTVNGKNSEALTFDRTGSWSSGWKIIRVKIKEEVGANYIELKTSGESAPNLDSIVIF
jgi:beta-galactosidase